jgi:putative (di)nucleoside polyphosphate hydrolase
VIRRAAGALVLRGGGVLLVHKVRVTGHPDGRRPVPGAWDLPKGGIVGAETVAEAALRELREETGSDRYRVVRVLAERIVFAFDAATRAATGWAGQETAMVLAEYLGDGSDLAPRDAEIDAVRFVPLAEAPTLLNHPETRAFLARAVPGVR